jgi:hypothetical protein
MTDWADADPQHALLMSALGNEDSTEEDEERALLADPMLSDEDRVFLLEEGQ